MSTKELCISLLLFALTLGAIIAASRTIPRHTYAEPVFDQR